ncbi:hypothetical protein YC2023_016660 [Brassica napus]
MSGQQLHIDRINRTPRVDAKDLLNNSPLRAFYFFLFLKRAMQALASPALHFCRHDQRKLLLEFRDEFPFDESKASPWNESSDCCHWKGVTCDDRYGQVISLDLSETSLNSSLKTNSSLFKLQYLHHLNLMECDLRGEIPSSLGNLSRLTLVDLSLNNLIGEIPASIGYLNNLRELILEKPLELSNNLLIGEIPASIKNLNGLRFMNLGRNSLSGNFRITFGNLTKLTDFYIHCNNFTSTLPSDMSGFHNLEGFSLGNKSLSSFKLKILDLCYNSFDGPIPEYISEFIKLTNLHLEHNDFTGSIPRSISNLVNLKLLHLSDNKLTGEIPRFILENMSSTFSHNRFSSLENTSQEIVIDILDLSSNSFRGPFPYWIKQLELLDLSNNFFNGSIPSCLRNNMVYLKELSLSSNSFSGGLPDIFVNAKGLLSFDVSRNQLEGKFPKSLINCKALQLVNVESNNIRDKIPSWLGSLPSLRVLSLRSNDFYGPLYHRHKSIGFRSLRVIDVSHNDLTGTLPPHYFFSWLEMTTLTDGEY